MNGKNPYLKRGFTNWHSKKISQYMDGISRLFILFLFSLIVRFSANAAPRFKDDTKVFVNPDSFPVPRGNPKQLFYLQRDPNTNTIVYELNLREDGSPDPDEPIHVFWIRYPEGGIHKELNYVQKKFAYGVKAIPMAGKQYKLIFTAYKKKNMVLAYAAKEKKYQVYAMLNGQLSVLNRVFIRIGNGGSFWAPDVKYIEMRGTAMSTGKQMTERIQISE